MKNTLLLAFLLFSSTLMAQEAGTLTMNPEQPMPGETVTITYQVGNSPLQKADQVFGLAYCLGGEERVILDIPLEKDGDAFTGSFTVSEDARLVAFLLDGETVQLSDYQGKVVVLDFWATWCGPCKVSFPAMQETLDKQKDNDEVVFLFINSWERKESNEKAEEAVRQFIEENEYSFNVPMDYDDEVVKSYKVSGIPTKFVIGPDGQIHFDPYFSYF